MLRSLRRSLALVIALALPHAAGCGGAADPAEPTESELRPARFVSAVDYLSARGGAGLDDWAAVRAELAASFAAECGDTFCEGDYDDLQPLDLRCSVGAHDGALRACTWALAGSLGTVSGSSGALSVTGKLYACPIPAHGTLDELIAALRGFTDLPALRRPLPGGAGTIADALGACGLGH